MSAIIQRYWLPLVGLNTVTITSAAMIAISSAKTWTADAQLILPDTTVNSDANLGTLGQLKDQGIAFTNELSPLQIQTSIMTSNNVIAEVWKSDPEKDKFKSIDSYKKLFKVKPVDQSTTVNLSVTGSLPELAKQRAHKLIESYERRLDQLRQGTAVAREKFTQTQIQQAELNLRIAKNQLAQFKQSTGLVNSEEQTKHLVDAIKILTNQQTQILAQARGAATKVKILGGQLGMTPQQAMDSLRVGQNKEYQTLRQKLSEVDTAIATERGRFTGEHPDIKKLLAERQELVTALNNELAKLLPNNPNVDVNFGGNGYQDTAMQLMAQLIQADSESKAYEQQALQIQNEVQTMKTQLSQISTQQAQLLDLQRKYDISEGVYKGIITQLEQTKISAFNAYPNVQVLDEPNVDAKPTSPKRSLIYLGGILTSVFASAALVLFLESRNPLLKPKDLEEIELPILARIPSLKSSQGRWLLESDKSIEFQRLASTISLMPLENRYLMVTSSSPGEGKTTITIGLAKALSLLGFRVLIVDADFQRAKLSQNFGYILPSDTSRLPEPVQINFGLDLLPAVPKPNQALMEFVGRGRFEAHLDTVQQTGNYDYVIVDTSPVGFTSETALIAKALTNVLMVVRIGVSDRHLLGESLEQLMRHNAQIIGLALNDVKQRTPGYVYNKQERREISS